LGAKPDSTPSLAFNGDFICGGRVSDIQDRRVLAKALNAIKATGFQVKAASILLAVNGLESALEFVANCAKLNTEGQGKTDETINPV
jgi:hypothetical protein